MRNKTIKSAIIGCLLLIPFFFAFKGYIEIPRYLNILGLSFNLYGLLIGLGALVVYELTSRLLTSKEKDLVKPFLPWMILFIFLGARFWHVVTDFYLYQNNLIGIFQVWNGGMSIFGALLGGLGSLYIYLKFFVFPDSDPGSKKLSILEKIALYLPLGQIIGRFGNFVNHELFGPPTNLPWGMFVPESYRPEQFKEFEFFHPAFLYEIIGNIVVFSILYKVYRVRGIKGDGLLLYIYLAGYSLVRFAVDFFRMDPDIIGFLSIGQIVTLLIFVVFILLILRNFGISRYINRNN